MALTGPYFSVLLLPLRFTVFVYFNSFFFCPGVFFFQYLFLDLNRSYTYKYFLSGQNVTSLFLDILILS